MRWFLFSLILFAATVLDGGNLLNLIALGSSHFRPAMLIVLLVFSCLHSRRKEAVICAFAAGFAADLVSAAMGPHMIVYGLMGIALSRLSHIMNMNRFIYQSFVVFIVFLLTQFPVAWLEAWKIGQLRPHLFLNTLGTALYTALFTSIIWLILGRIWKHVCPHIEGRSRRR